MPQITEVDLLQQYVRIQNVSTESADINGFSLRTSAGFQMSFQVSQLIAAGQHFSVWTGRDGMSNAQQDAAASVCYTQDDVWNLDGMHRRAFWLTDV